MDPIDKKDGVWLIAWMLQIKDNAHKKVNTKNVYAALFMNSVHYKLDIWICNAYI